MIYELRNIPPYITFANGYTQHTGKQGDTATVWLNTLYNQEVYDFTVQATGGTVAKTSDYEYAVTYPNKGAFTIQLTVFTRVKETVKENDNRELPVQTAAAQPKGIVLLSNILEINIL